MLGHLRTRPVGIDERRRVFMKALRNKEEGMKTCITNLSLTIDMLNWNQIVDYARNWDKSLLGKERIIVNNKRKQADVCYSIEGEDDWLDPPAKKSKCDHCGKPHHSSACWQKHPEKMPDWLKEKKKNRDKKQGGGQSGGKTQKTKPFASSSGSTPKKPPFTWPKKKKKEESKDTVSMIFDMVANLDDSLVDDDSIF